jgi:mutator protein MutT
MSTEKMHLGIYGILVENGRILLIKKSRGPYVGKLDLPGGKLEHGEDLEAALKRELKEETGVIVNNCQLITNMTATVEFEYEGEQINMYHVGLIYKIINSDNENLIAEMNVEDSFGAEWVDISSVNLNNLSPFAMQVIEQKLYEN